MAERGPRMEDTLGSRVMLLALHIPDCDGTEDQEMAETMADELVAIINEKRRRNAGHRLSLDERVVVDGLLVPQWLSVDHQKYLGDAIRRYRMVYPFGLHRHGGETRHGYSHAHAYPDYEHGHFLRAVCRSPACQGADTHDIHEMPEGAPTQHD